MHLSLAAVLVVGWSAVALAAPISDLQQSSIACKGAFQCRTLYRPPNSIATCRNSLCGYECEEGYVALGKRRCIPEARASEVVSRASESAASATSTTTPAPLPSSTATSALPSTSVTTTTTSSAPPPTSSGNALTEAGVTGFSGTNTNAILSWFDTNSGRDSTNGNSWCGFPYDNSVPGFAPSLDTMLANFDGDYASAAKAYCGLEAEITTPDGRTVTLYVADAFDDTWVRTPASLDIIHGSFESLYGSYTDNKNNVVKNASWRFTGRRNERLAFKSTDSLGGWGTPEPPVSSLTSTSTAPTTVQTSATDTAPTPSSSANALTQAGISGFLGNNTNAILSWYDTNSGRDSTNGNSWCGFPYSNDLPGFAPSLRTMLSNFDYDYETAARAYCGLEAVITTPDGRTATMYIADAFDDTWVITPSSLDIIHGSFAQLYGSWTDNKLDVVKNAHWQLTGRRNERLTFKSKNSLGGWS